MEMQDNLQEADGNKEENNKGDDLKKKPSSAMKFQPKKQILKTKKMKLKLLLKLPLTTPKKLA